MGTWHAWCVFGVRLTRSPVLRGRGKPPSWLPSSWPNADAGFGPNDYKIWRSQVPQGPQGAAFLLEAPGGESVSCSSGRQQNPASCGWRPDIFGRQPSAYRGNEVLGVREVTNGFVARN